MMSTFEQLKKAWDEKQNDMPGTPAYNHKSLEKVVRARVNKHTRAALQYFWASFALQVLLYSLLCHLIIKYWNDREILYLSIGGVLLFLPFTIILMQKFKSLATTKLSKEESIATSLYDFVLHQQTLLRRFYKFKKWYEFFLTPLSAAIGVIVTFKLYVPGGVSEHSTGAIITFFITLISCITAIRSENKKSFKWPIRQLQNVLDDFRNEV